MNGVLDVHHLTLRAFNAATAIVAGLPEQVPPGLEHGDTFLRCHEVARTVHRLLGDLGSFEVVDGHYGPYEHSWLASRPLKTILDVYAIGRQPIVQIVDPFLVSAIDYRPGPKRDDIRESVIRHLIHGGYPSPGLEPGFYERVTEGHPYFVRD